MNILLIDDHALFRQGLKFLLADLVEDITFFEAPSIPEIKLHAKSSIDLVLLDLNLPGADGLSGLEEVREIYPNSVVVILSGQEEPRFVKSTINAGASGFIPKSSTPEVMVTALRLVLAGGVYLPPLALGLLFSDDGEKSRTVTHADAEKLQGLTLRQSEALRLVVKGYSNKAIARELSVSEGTVKQHLSVAFQVLGVANRTEAVYALAASGSSLAKNA